MRRWTAGVVMVVGLGLSACSGGKKEPTPSEKVAQVVDKGGPAKAEPTKAPAANNVAPDPAPAPKETAPVAEPTPTPSEPAKVEPAPPVEPIAKVEPAPPVEPIAKVEPPKTEPSPTTPSGQAMHTITVNDSAMTVAIDNRFPSERKTSFSIGVDAKVYAWFDFKNTGDKTALTLVWKKEGKEVWRIDTNVGVSKSWRTWAEKKLGKKDAGRWSVDAIDAGGHVYGTLTYEVTGG